MQQRASDNWCRGRKKRKASPGGGYFYIAATMDPRVCPEPEREPVPALRVVSLLSASTEMIYAMGLEDKLVGRSHECDRPAPCLALPQVSRATIDDLQSAAEIDRAVLARVVRGLSVYSLDTALLRRLQPTVIVTQDTCRVCAARGWVSKTVL